MALTSNEITISEMYLAAFLRAPEKSGLEYWTSMLDDGISLSEVGDIMFSLPIVQDIYPPDMSNTDFVSAIYQNVFGRPSDSDGLDYWAGKMDDGEHRGELVMDMITAGLGTPDGTPGKQYIANRLDVATYAAEQQKITGLEISPGVLATTIAAVDSSDSTAIAGKQLIDSLFGTNPGTGLPDAEHIGLALMPTQGTRLLSTSQLEFVAGLIEARSYSNTFDTDDIVDEYDLGWLVVHTVLNNETLPYTAFNLTSAQVEQVLAYESYLDEVVALPIATQMSDAAFGWVIGATTGDIVGAPPASIADEIEMTWEHIHNTFTARVIGTYDALDSGQASADWIIV